MFQFLRSTNAVVNFVSLSFDIDLDDLIFGLIGSFEDDTFRARLQGIDPSPSRKCPLIGFPLL